MKLSRRKRRLGKRKFRKKFKLNCLYGFSYNPLLTLPYWSELIEKDKIKSSSEYLILCFPTRKGYVIGKFRDNHSEILISDKINELYLNKLSYNAWIPLENNYPLVYYFETKLSKNKIEKLFQDLSISCDASTYTKGFF